MRATTQYSNVNTSNKIAISTKELQSLLSCGYATAVKIGTLAEAKIKIGTRVLWNVEKVREYMKHVSTGE